MNEQTWNEIKKFYKEVFGIDEELVELMACDNVLLMCASGSSNPSIAHTLELDIGSVNEIISRIFGFEGWQVDLPFNPYRLFNDLVTNGKALFADFKQAAVYLMSLRGLVMTDSYIEIMFRICRVYSNIERDLEREWK